METEFTKQCDRLRQTIKQAGDAVLALKNHSAFVSLPTTANPGEMMANIMLAYRHLEDARMRIGKSIQAFDGGTSVYDREQS